MPASRQGLLSWYMYAFQLPLLPEAGCPAARAARRLPAPRGHEPPRRWPASAARSWSTARCRARWAGTARMFLADPRPCPPAGSGCPRRWCGATATSRSAAQGVDAAAAYVDAALPPRGAGGREPLDPDAGAGAAGRARPRRGSRARGPTRTGRRDRRRPPAPAPPPRSGPAAAATASGRPPPSRCRTRWSTTTATSTSPTATGLVPTDEALAAAAAVGVPRIVQIGCDLPGARWAVEAAASYDALVAGVALHPNEAPRHAAAGTLDEALAEIEALAGAHDRVRAVGETGLDHFRTGEDGPGRAGGVVPPAHRPGQAARQDAGHPRPRRPRRGAARSSTRRARPSAG